MRRLLNILLLSLMLVVTSCEHKDLCLYHHDHAHKYYINVIPEYRLDWEEQYDGTDWEANWPADWYPYDTLRPEKPQGLRVINYVEGLGSDLHNISADGGVVTLYSGENDILIYNNDTEYIVFTRQDDGRGATTRATTRTRTRATYTGNRYANPDEVTVTPPDMLFANYKAAYVPAKVLTPVEYPATLYPLVFTYKIRYEFAEGLKYVARAQGALSGMARSVTMNTGETSKEGATILYDCEVVDYGVRAFVTSFGVPAFPNINYDTRSTNKHALNLEILLRNGKTTILEFDVTDQVKSQPHGGVITVSDIVIKPEEGAAGSGAFDVEVGDWGDYEDIELPIF